jgi:uncharacterized protein YndB with AHSA1/START domain
MIGRLILTPIRLALVGLGVAWVADRLLRLLARGAPPEPIRSLVVIDAPIDGVWDVVVDIERQPLWMREMKAVRVLTPGPLGVGTRGEATVRVLGITTIDPVTVTQFEPPTRFAIRHEGAFTGSGLITLEPGADGTTTILRWEETLIAPALPHVAAAAMAPVMRSIFQGDLLRLRDLVEGEVEAASARRQPGDDRDAARQPPETTLDDLPASTTV